MILRTIIHARSFHTSAPRHVNPLVILLIKPVLKGFTWITGRSTRKWLKSLPSEKRSILKEHLRRQKFKYLGVTSSIVGLAAVHYYTHIEEESLTGRRRYMMTSMKQMDQLNEMVKESLAGEYQSKILPENSPHTQRVANVAMKILHANLDIPGIRDKTWTVRVIDNETKNAMVLASGDIYVFTGIIDSLKTDDQLAAVLGHEISHAILSHSAEKLSHSTIIDGIGLIAAFLIWTIMPTDYTSFIMNMIFDKFMKFYKTLPYSRAVEQEADEVGMRVAAKACYDIREFVTIWSLIGDQESESETMWSTHPSSKMRAENMMEKLPIALDFRQKCKCATLPDREGLPADVPLAEDKQTINPKLRRLYSIDGVFTAAT